MSHAATPATRARRDVLVTGEAVLLDLRPASFATRALSFAIDGTLTMLLLVGATWGITTIGLAYGLDQGYLRAGGLAVSVAALIGLPVLCEALTGGRSPGRWALGTRVVRDDGGPVHVRQSLLRALAAVLEIWGASGMLALVVSMIDPRSRRLGDLLAGTFVIQERLRAPQPVREEAPEELVAWARSADVGRLPIPLLQEIRGFLPRAAMLSATSRRALALDLVEQVVPAIAPPPPPGTDPESFLRAVLAERSRRDEERLRVGLEREETLTAQVRALPFSS